MVFGSQNFIGLPVEDQLLEGWQQSDNENRPRSDLVIVMALTPCFLAVCFVGYFLDDFPLYIYIYRYMI